MSGLFDAQEPTVTWVDRTKTIVPPALVGLLFVFIGYTKFDGNPRGEWYQIFERIGLGQWVRWFTGVMQVNVTKDGSDVIVHINLSGDKADEMRIVLDNTSLSSMDKGDFIL